MLNMNMPCDSHSHHCTVPLSISYRSQRDVQHSSMPGNLQQFQVIGPHTGLFLSKQGGCNAQGIHGVCDLYFGLVARSSQPPSSVWGRTSCCLGFMPISRCWHPCLTCTGVMLPVRMYLGKIITQQPLRSHQPASRIFHWNVSSWSIYTHFTSFHVKQ